MLVTDRGQTIRTRVAEIRLTGRNAQGVRVMNVEAGERVVAIEPVGEREDDEAGASGEKGRADGDESAEESSTDRDTNGVAKAAPDGDEGDDGSDEAEAGSGETSAQDDEDGDDEGTPSDE
jgi:DNA gyrase subunit A